jgi:hypothetical protein
MIESLIFPEPTIKSKIIIKADNIACSLYHHAPKPWNVYQDPLKEFVRQGIDEKLMRVYKGNKEYLVSPTYPRLNVLPRCVSDE